MISSDRMAAVDVNAAALGIPRKQLMESSGNAVARVVRSEADPGSRIVLVCGRGNNGGDAFVTARFLSEYDIETALLGRPDAIGTQIARENWDALQAADLSTTTITDTSYLDGLDLEAADCIVDAMLGTGVTGALREPEASAARAINATDTPVVSVDVPSGVDADTGAADGVAVEADHVVTFHDTKRGLESLDTQLTVADIGIPEAAELFVGPGDVRGRKRAAESHKGDHGELLVIGGGPYTGAPALAAQAALRAGADLVHVSCPETVAEEIQGYSENLIVHPFDGQRLTPEAVDAILDLAGEMDAVICGPGLGSHEETLAAVESFLESFSGRGVIDADALSVVPEVDTDASLICTPHQGELVKMGGETDDDWERRAELVTEFATEIGQTLLVKGAYDIIADSEETRVSRTGNPGMTVGGTGDVLAGVVGSLFTNREPRTSAAVGAYLNGRAGDLAFEDAAYGLVATDLIDWLPEPFTTDE
ncbi:NAD(P)H-hydrate epimerase [Halohasta litchfieldiae]|jgi:NAD(P)H-hydrate epimerase|uniref:Bifunctional NAD(P)H-hydrate repair enzyme n=1 Tax=Halohasta litchfieldiae TaxID=1073996 RepID=A0A1H6VNZ9_9EURY|nr:NAD(P)H-hydrate dehydratase [Halohasta litchfieldiae]ATW88982.1 NAD(P)H-hydrate epimerase [Halohasta litchfieldiae]SEJ01805.1 NAD(P)H-hydrate epimerase [Halohasta litchfieldiae]